MDELLDQAIFESTKYANCKEYEWYLTEWLTAKYLAKPKAKPKTDCSTLFNCCDCGGADCGCAYCASCRYCENCYEDNGEPCLNADYNL